MPAVLRSGLLPVHISQTAGAAPETGQKHAFGDITRSTPPAGPQIRGARGRGFIAPEHGREDVFLHLNDMDSRVAPLCEALDRNE
ncbi:hypothetical protein E6W39_11125 [Kitasatospora acidiphila]|uniref:Uncharacterized protein n=1 Tax=Kitasatospora acidiphila TaxID=2567942 RepID=A0A540W112_9ACTN|nr:hypothetical protein E6W39_11125 [Kitasatospora acidiphila]